jgi:hypothetical protein
MPNLDSSWITTLLGLAGTFLGIAVLVQVVQELYKYLTKSKGRAYTQALVDFLGPWAQQLLHSDAIPDMRVRGPFQLKRLRPKGMLLPLEKEELASALERTLPLWVRRTLEALEVEQKFVSAGAGEASPGWKAFLEEIGRAEQGSPGYWNALTIAEFLERWKHIVSRPPSGEGIAPVIGAIQPPATIDPTQLLAAFRREFLSHIDDAIERFPQLQKNFDYAYERRNTRHTFTIALILAVLFNLPFSRLYEQSKQLSSEEAVALAQTSIDLHNRQMALPRGADSAATDSTMKLQLGIARKVLGDVLHRIDTTSRKDPDSGEEGSILLNLREVLEPFEKGWDASFRFLFGCLVTALLVSFGAPFWNDLASALLRLQKGRKTTEQTPEDARHG